MAVCVDRGSPDIVGDVDGVLTGNATPEGDNARDTDAPRLADIVAPVILKSKLDDDVLVVVGTHVYVVPAWTLIPEAI